MKAKLLYRCRKCSMLIRSEPTQVSEPTGTREVLLVPGGFPPTAWHQCHENVWGIGDFCGVEKA